MLMVAVTPLTASGSQTAKFAEGNLPLAINTISPNPPNLRLAMSVTAAGVTQSPTVSIGSPSSFELRANGTRIASATSAEFNSSHGYLNVYIDFPGIISQMCIGDAYTLHVAANVSGLPTSTNGTWTLSAGESYGVSTTILEATNLIVNCSQQPPAQNPSSNLTSAKYAGPEFSSLSLKPVMHGTSTTLTGKRLSQVSSIEIGGKAATFTSVSDTELSLTPAADLAPGTYDLVINSAAGKLSHMNAVRIQPALRSFSVTTRAENRITEEQYQEHSLIASMQQTELTKARCIVNGPNLAQAKAQAERLCALVKAANPNIETTVIDPRSTVKNNTVFARVTYGWN